MKEIKGWHVFGAFFAAFSVIILANLTLAVNAVRTFPGLEVRNSYVASQSFDDDRSAQTALGWDVAAFIDGEELLLSIQDETGPISPKIIKAIFGSATHVGQDQTPDFVFDGTYLRAKVRAGAGNWNLRLIAESGDGTVFQQRIIVQAVE